MLNFSFQVSWLKREPGSSGMPVLLTFGSTIYISDARISIKRYSDDWVLSIVHVKPEDEGVYECQVTHDLCHLEVYMIIMDLFLRFQLSLPKFIRCKLSLKVSQPTFKPY